MLKITLVVELISIDFRFTMSSQPIVVPGGEHRPHTEAHSVPVGGSTDSFKTMTPPNVSRSFSREYIVTHAT